MNCFRVKTLLTISALVLFLSHFSIAQTLVTGAIQDGITTQALRGVKVSLENTPFSVVTDEQGVFSFDESNLPLGEQVLTLSHDGYIGSRYPIIINKGEVLDLGVLFLSPDLTQESLLIGTISLSDEELSNEESVADNFSGLLQSSADTFLQAAAYDFGSTFFRPRGLDSKDSKVLINGLEMNKMFNGRPQWTNWGGLNDVLRNQVFTPSSKANDYNFGDIAGTTNIIIRASEYRKGGKISYAASNRSYTGRIMGSYSSGMTGSGWAYSVLASRRFGNEGFVEGSFYDANSFFASVEKKFNENHSLNFSGIYAQNKRGKTSPNTQEVYNIKGIRYNDFWGWQDGKKRNSRVKRTEEPIFMLNHYWKLSEKSKLNTNISYQFGEVGNSRLGYDDAPNPSPTYYRYLPSFVLSQKKVDYKAAYKRLTYFTENGQMNWDDFYKTNIVHGGTSRYYLYEDRNDDQVWTANTIFSSNINNHIKLNGSISYRHLTSTNFASMLDLLGGKGYLDIDSFNKGDAAQNNLDNPNRLIQKGDKFRYNYIFNTNEIKGFAQAQFSYNKVDFYLGGAIGRTAYQRDGLYRSGSFPTNSFGKSKELDFTTYGTKAGITYKITGRHQLDFNGAYVTEAPGLRNSFSNARQNNNTVRDLKEIHKLSADASYIFRTPIIKARLTGYYSLINNQTNVSFFYADGISLISEINNRAFIQEILRDFNTKHLGGEFGIEAQVTPTIKLKGAAAVGQYTYDNNPDLYITSDDFSKEYYLGKSYIKDYHVAGGPQRAYQIGFEYRDPDFWFVGATFNYFSNAYINISPIMRTKNFYSNSKGGLIHNYDEKVARELLRQEKIAPYNLVNLIGGKTWKVKGYYIGLFATISNLFDTVYKTGGFEQGRNANYTKLLEDSKKEYRNFGPKYWYGYGTNYYLSLNVRF